MNLKASTVCECFTHRKNELVIHLESDEDMFIRIGLNSHTPYFLKYKVQSIKDPRTFFFTEITGEKIKALKIIPYDKIIYILMHNYSLKCVFFGKEKNILLLNSEHAILETFKKTRLSADTPLTQSPEIPLSMEDLLKIDRTEIKQILTSFLMKNIGGYNKLLSEEVCFRSDVDPDIQLSELTESQWKRILENIVSINADLIGEESYLYEHPTDSTILSLIQLKKISDTYTSKTFHDPNTAWKQFIYRFQQINSLEKILNQSREKIKRRINYLEKTLKKVTDFEDLEKKKTLAELKGHLLQTFSSEIKKGIDLVKLKNIYSTQEEYVSIQLNPKLSVQENALKYFNKYKDINTQKKTLKEKRDTYRDELNYWKKMYHDSEKIDNLKKAEKLNQILSQKKLIQRINVSKKSDSILDISTFNRILLKEKWEILIGKNAENNDLLSFKFARKHDIWLHAQGVTGSHVVIRRPDKNTNPPMTIIEQAASIAAYFSSAKNSSTVPVNYTEVRYVRKPRKAPPGTALITNSKTIFVEPKKYI
jgi:predicted ribosome quality control (RQC) complex YloA/Tae2 family protein